MRSLKNNVYQVCVQRVTAKLNTVETTLVNLQESLLSETKSTAGDKHETGRAMVQLEMEKTGAQLADVQAQQQVLKRVSTLDEAMPVVRLGSLIQTNKGYYYIAISLGMLTVENTSVFVISASAPIAQVFLGKKVGETVTFNQQEFQIIAIQ